KECGDSSRYGSGLIDCEYAIENYAEFERTYEKNKDDYEIENDEEVEVDEGIDKISGSWETDVHKGFVKKDGRFGIDSDLEQSLVKTLYRATWIADNKDNDGVPGTVGMSYHPWFHGFYDLRKEIDVKEDGKTVKKRVHDKYCNFVTSYLYLYKISGDLYKKKSVKKIFNDSKLDIKKLPKEDRNAIKGIQRDISDEKIGKFTWKAVLPKGVKANNKTKSLLIFGMALHSLTDMYAHSTYYGKAGDKKNGKISLKRIVHDKDKNGNALPGKADNTEFKKNRYRNAKSAAKELLKKIKINGNGEYTGIKSVKDAGSVYLAPKYQNITDYIITGMNNTQILKMEYFKNAYLIRYFYKYLANSGIFKNFNDRYYDRTKFKNMSCKQVLNILKRFKAYKLNNKSGKNEYNLAFRNTKNGEELLNINIKTKSIWICISKSSDVIVNVTDTETKNRAVLRCFDGKLGVVNIGELGDKNEFYQTEIQEEDEEGDDEETYYSSVRGIKGDADFSDEEITACDSISADYTLTSNGYYMVIETDKNSDITCMLIAYDFDADEFDVCDRGVNDYTLDLDLNNIDKDELNQIISGDSNLSFTEAENNEKKTTVVSVKNVEENCVYVFLVRKDIYDERRNDENIMDLALSGVKAYFYRYGESAPLFVKQVPYTTGYCWQPCYVTGDYSLLYLTDNVTYDIEFNIGGGVLYAQ
ncbi:MAG: hypothetical protein K6G11_02605, partial [Lachnospiraceae bacterium]|nr:hypothetical protein [Lachnospiraceae bacterium]